ncbi:MAG: hypothetical protein KDA33_07520 [Phycisphaerales bacterium]|nr:hypothetical protein [Phycisphaerales bacterium]
MKAPPAPAVSTGMDIKNPAVLKLKGVLFLLLGSLAGAILLIRSLEWETAALLALTIWAFCRFYYFAFYVLHEYADPSFKYAGLWDLSLYLIGWKKDRPRREMGGESDERRASQP